MELKLIRHTFTPFCTQGDLIIDGEYFSLTLEDTNREGDIFTVKIPKETAIPYGRYKMVLSMSPKFKRMLPEILQVPNFSGVRIHSGVTVEHTEGCPLIGKFAIRSGDTITISGGLKLMPHLIGKLQLAESGKEESFLTVMKGERLHGVPV
jgi:hypothetical protein